MTPSNLKNNTVQVDNPVNPDRKRIGIFPRTFILSFLLPLLIITIFAVTIIPRQREVLIKTTLANARSVSASIAHVCGNAIVSGDYGFIVKHNMELIRFSPDILYIAVVRRSGFTLVHTDKGWEQKEKPLSEWIVNNSEVESGQIIHSTLVRKEVFHYSFPLTYSKLNWGTLYLGLSLDHLNKELKSMNVSMLSLSLLCFAIGVSGSYFFARRLTRPILALRQISSRIAQGDLSVRADIISRNEIGDLAISFNQMSANIQKREKALRESEEKLKTIFENANDLIIYFDVEGTVIDLNNKVEDIFGYKREEIIGKKIADIQILNFREFEKSRQISRRIIAGKSTQMEELEGICKDGSKVFVEANPRLIEKHGEMKGFLVIVRDITKRKKADKVLKMAEEALRESEKKYRSIFENAVEGIFQITPDRHIFSANQSLAGILGYNSPEELLSFFTDFVGQTYVDPESQKQFDKLIEEEGKVIGFETQLFRKDKSIITVALSVHAVLDSFGKVINYDGSLVDITELKEKERAEIERESAEAATKSKSEFLANMSHEIRTPMNAILGFTELLGEQIEEPKQKQYLSAISSSGKSLLTIINDILDLSKIEAGKFELRNEAIKLHSILNEIKQMFSKKVNDKGLDFLIESDLSVAEKVVLDEVRLRQILLNLVGNAVKFTDKGFVKLGIKQRSSTKNADFVELVFSVQDTGIGIPDDQKAFIFESFRQQEGQKAKYGGTGLGLSITKRLVEIMGGKIIVESEVGKGTTFIFEFKNVAIASEADVTDVIVDINIDSIRFDESSILIVDDIEYNRLLIQGFLNTTHIKIFEAENGREAVEKTKAYHPDLILMDMKMPVCDGYEATRILKTDKDLKSIPVIALTAYAMTEDVLKIENSDCDGFIKKPVSRVELINELMRHLSYSTEDNEDRRDTENNKKLISQKPLSPETKHRLPELLNLLVTEIKTDWERIQSAFVISEIEDFTGKIKSLGEEYNLDILKNWGEELAGQLMSFDMDRLPETLKNFSEIIRKIDSLIEG